MRDFLKAIHEIDLYPVGKTENNRFYYPAEEARTKETTEAMRLAEHKLDNFWYYVDRFVFKELRMPLTKHFDLEPRPLLRTDPWREVRKGGNVQDMTEILYTWHLSEGSNESFDGKSFATSKTKEKTRNATPSDQSPESVKAAVDEESTAQHMDPERQQINVPRRCAKVFRALFTTSGATAGTKVITWTEFLQAMAATGFAPEKLYGSVWQFTNTDMSRSIHFYEPHPEHTLPLYLARRMGRRLKRAFGWQGDDFVSHA